MPTSHRKAALAVWGTAMLIYVVATGGRASFGVAGLDALDRFEINASTLSLFTVVQFGVYAGAQIPIGILLDKYGPRRILLSGALLLAIGQVGMALADSLSLALAVRALIGVGDATAFTGVLRLLPSWFPPRSVPLMTQLTSIGGTAGQIVSSLPFAYMLHNQGWSPAFLMLGGLGILGVVLGLLILRDTPDDWRSKADKESSAELAVEAAGAVVDVDRVPISQVLKEPGAWLGFWTHWTGGFPHMVFMLLWGVPFLEIHNGLSSASAAAILLVTTFSGVLFGPIIGRLVAAHPFRRTWIVQGAAILTVIIWVVVLLIPAPTPMPVLIILLMTLALAGSASSVGFDFARTSVPLSRLGTANGLVNMGGFIAGLITNLGIGVLLDISSGGAAYDAADFKVAFAFQLVMLAFGMLMIEIFKRKTRKRMAARGTVVPPLRDVIARYQVRWEQRRQDKRGLN